MPIPRSNKDEFFIHDIHPFYIHAINPFYINAINPFYIHAINPFLIHEIKQFFTHTPINDERSSIIFYEKCKPVFFIYLDDHRNNLFYTKHYRI